MSIEALKSGRITNAKTDGNREFLNLLACICADGTKLSVGLIYKGESHDLQESWVDDLGEDIAYFAASANGWSCDSLGLQWLQKIFDRHTKEKTGRSKRLLIVDGHSSHVNMAFLDWADKHGIIIHILPAHCTHRMQPLDVGLFSPLSTAYTKQLNNLMFKSLGMVTMTKRLFYPLFRAAWIEAFTEKNILKSFAKPGIWPCDRSQIINILQKPKDQATEFELERQASILQTPKSCQAVHRMHKVFRLQRAEPILDKILNSNIHLAAQVSIQNHIITGLREAFQIEKRKRRKGKRLNLLGENDVGPQFYSPSQIKAALVVQNAKTAEEQANRQRIADNKVKAVAA